MTSPSEAEQTTKRRRVARDGTVRFKEDDARVLAAAEAMVPAEHLARQVRRLMERVDVSQVQAQGCPHEDIGLPYPPTGPCSSNLAACSRRDGCTEESPASSARSVELSRGTIFAPTSGGR
jgi:hypothetical protein